MPALLIKVSIRPKRIESSLDYLPRYRRLTHVAGDRDVVRIVGRLDRPRISDYAPPTLPVGLYESLAQSLGGTRHDKNFTCSTHNFI